MFKYIIGFLMLNCAALFAGDMDFQRNDHLDCTSKYAVEQLGRAQGVLNTLVSNPQDYQLMLSDKPYFGGEAVPENVLSPKPTIIIYQGALDPQVATEELTFMMAHELGHIHHKHMQNCDQRMEKIMTGPVAGISGTTFNIFAQKCEERQADLFGFELFKKSGYDINFFPDTYKYIVEHNGHDRHTPDHVKLLPSLSMKDAHFSMQERFALLSEKTGLAFS